MYDATPGLSSQAIAYGGDDHPWDPGDLLRCVNYCERNGITTEKLRTRMAGRSTAWDRLLPEWGALTDLLHHELQTRTDNKAPRTYSEMRRVLAGGTRCEDCDGTGRGEPCAKCKGSGYRSGGRCRAPHCLHGAAYCQNCRGNGYTINKEPDR